MANRFPEPPGPRLYCYDWDPIQATPRMTWGDSDLNALDLPDRQDPDDYGPALRLDGYRGRGDWRRVVVLVARGPEGQRVAIHLPPDDPFLKGLGMG